MSGVAAELDAMHAQARLAFDRKDLAAYRDFFSPGLVYRQADGRVIDRDHLMHDVAAQFRNLGHVRSSFVRERLDIEGDRAIEVIDQTATAWSTAFRVIHRGWTVARKGRYSWRREDDGAWRIEEVEVISEHLSGRFHLGLRLPQDP